MKGMELQTNARTEINWPLAGVCLTSYMRCQCPQGAHPDEPLSSLNRDTPLSYLRYGISVPCSSPDSPNLETARRFSVARRRSPHTVRMHFGNIVNDQESSKNIGSRANASSDRETGRLGGSACADPAEVRVNKFVLLSSSYEEGCKKAGIVI